MLFYPRQVPPLPVLWGASRMPVRSSRDSTAVAFGESCIRTCGAARQSSRQGRRWAGASGAQWALR
eukprot:2260617-Prymnesium_polylepis.1